MPEPDFNKTPAKKLTPEQKKYFSSMDTTASVFTESEIRAVKEGGDQALADVMAQQNADAIAALKTNADAEASTSTQQPFVRSASDTADPIIQGPTRAQDNFTLRQSPMVQMTGVPRQKFEYIATFRLSSDQQFETIFSDADIENLDQQITSAGQTADDFVGGGGIDAIAKKNLRKQHNDLKSKRQQVMETIRRSLVFNVKQIDGPKVNFQYDTLNQYNRKRNVYRRVDYDPVSVRFYDTMNNTALKFWRYLYELNLKDGRNRHPTYGGDRKNNSGLYSPNPLTREDQFMNEHNFGLESSTINHTYPIKSLDLFIVHGGKYNLIRFVHPKVIAMDHDLLTYEASTPIELGLQFAYESVVYETLNYDMSASSHDVAVDFDEIFENSLKMPETPATAQAETEGSDGTSQNEEYSWTKLSTSIPDEQTIRTSGTGTKAGSSDAFNHQTNSTGAAYGGKQSILDGIQSDLAQMNADLSTISPTPFSDAISSVSSEVYSTTKSAVSSFSSGGKSGGGNNSLFNGGLGDAFKNLGPGDGRYNPDSKNFKGNKSASNVDKNGKITKNKNGNVSRNNIINSSGYDAQFAERVKNR